MISEAITQFPTWSSLSALNSERLNQEIKDFTDQTPEEKVVTIAERKKKDQIVKVELEVIDEEEYKSDNWAIKVAIGSIIIFILFMACQGVR